jgi:hypothetical protein
LENGGTIIFGTTETPADGELTSCLAYITSHWNEDAKQYETPWQVRLEAQPWRARETGEISARACPAIGTWDDSITKGNLSLCATTPPTFIEATRPKEIKALIKFGRDSAWPLKITATSALDEQISLSITYDVNWEDLGGSIEWVWTKFYAMANADGITQPPAFQRSDVKWALSIRKDDNAFRIIVREQLPDGTWPSAPEDPGKPILLPYAPMAEIKIRSLADEQIPSLTECVERLYQGRARVTEIVQTKE